jgi:multidrug resistance efflux pump
VAGAGIVEAQTENISVGSQLPGVVTRVLVVVGQKVKAGEPLFTLDERAMRAELAVREANLAAAQAELGRLQALPRPEEIPPTLAKMRAAEAIMRQQKDLSERAKKLGREAIAEEEMIRREHEFNSAKERFAEADAQLELLKAGAWEKDLAMARARVQQSQAQVEQTRVEIDRLTVRAQVDGEVLQVNVRPGEFVGAPHGQALIVLGDCSRLHVRVDIDERDIPRFHKEAPARAIVRGHHHLEFPLRFVRVEPFVVPKKSLTGDNSERVDTRVLQVIFALEPQEQPVYVGQQMDVFIDGR